MYQQGVAIGGVKKLCRWQTPHTRHYGNTHTHTTHNALWQHTHTTHKSLWQHTHTHHTQGIMATHTHIPHTGHIMTTHTHAPCPER